MPFKLAGFHWSNITEVQLISRELSVCWGLLPQVNTAYQGFIQDFSTGGGGQHQCHCAAIHTTLGGVGWGHWEGGGIMPVLTWLVGRGAFPSCTAHQIYYRKSESMSEILGFVTYFRGGSTILQGGAGCMLDHLHNQLAFEFCVSEN